MPTILELFRGSDFDKAVDSKAKEGKGTLFAQIKSFGEQELTGIRVKSAVELNNPLIYGNEATRIALRTTPIKDKMEDTSKSPDRGDGGLIGAGLGAITGGRVNSLTDARDKVNNLLSDKLGIPIKQIPSRYYTKLGDTPLKDYESTIADLVSGGKGSGVFRNLRGGNPKTIGQQAAGALLQEAKNKVRNALFKNNPFSKEQPDSKEVEKVVPKIYDKKSTYSETNKGTAGSTDGTSLAEKGTDSKNLTEDGSQDTNVGRYTSTEQQLGNLRVGKSFVQVTGLDEQGNQVKIEPGENDGVNPKTKPEKIKFTKDENYTSTFTDKKDLIFAEDGKGFGNGTDIINASGIYDGGTGAETDLSKFELDKKDFIPLYFRNIVTGETVHFRGTITGLSETVSPSWGSGKFSGNPFSYHTYESIERTVAFNFTIYPMNSFELANNWSKIEFLTSLTYPLGYQSGQIGSVRAPIIYFTMGDLYKDKVCFIDSLQYTIPDNSNWQLDGKTKAEGERETDGDYLDRVGSSKSDTSKGYKLPHLVEVATTLKFIEQRNNTEDRTKLYSFKSLTYGN
jgi:hypothetical protein|tara:strand:+ start:3 stop:1700 length:1698 start_codon:yes stop_codon:yes gene_type:complete